MEVNHQGLTDSQKLDKILIILNGNGKIGMCAKVELMWWRMTRIIVCIFGICGFLVGRVIWEVMNKG